MFLCPFSTDPSLTPYNLTLALQSLPDEEWRWFGREMDVPESTLDKIQSQFHSDKERKAAVIRVYLIEHPHPTWEHVSDVLYQYEYHSVLERLQSLFPTGEHRQVTCYHHSLVYGGLSLVNPQTSSVVMLCIVTHLIHCVNIHVHIFLISADCN